MVNSTKADNLELVLLRGDHHTEPDPSLTASTICPLVKLSEYVGALTMLQEHYLSSFSSFLAFPWPIFWRSVSESSVASNHPHASAKDSNG